MDGAGTISGRWALAAGRAGVKGCRICSGPTLPGTRLCTQCKAALKRARQETVSELAPPLKRPVPRATTRPQRAAKVAPAPRTTGRRVSRGVAIALVTIAAVALGYVVLHLAQPTHPVASEHAEPASLPAATLSAQPVRPDPAAGAQAREGPPVAAPAHEAKSALPRAAPKRAVEAAPAAAPPPVDRFPAVTEPAALPPVPEPAPAPRLAPPPRDRWQVMADEIAQCGRDGFLSGVICEQKIRIKYCEGYWGQAAQCPSGIQNDHGR